MHTVRSIVARALIGLVTMLALLGAPAPAMAGGGTVAKAKAKVVAAATATKSGAQRAALGGMSLAGNMGWGVATGAMAVASAVHGDMSGAAIFGGFSTFNLVQAVRKWKAEKSTAAQ